MGRIGRASLREELHRIETSVLGQPEQFGAHHGETHLLDVVTRRNRSVLAETLLQRTQTPADSVGDVLDRLRPGLMGHDEGYGGLDLSGGGRGHHGPSNRAASEPRQRAGISGTNALPSRRLSWGAVASGASPPKSASKVAVIAASSAASP